MWTYLQQRWRSFGYAFKGVATLFQTQAHAWLHLLAALLVIIAGLCWWTGQASAFCPSQCQCNDHALEANCVSARLDVVPILLNPALRSLKLAHNRISTIRQVRTFASILLMPVVIHGSRKLLSLESLKHLKLVVVVKDAISMHLNTTCNKE